MRDRWWKTVLIGGLSLVIWPGLGLHPAVARVMVPERVEEVTLAGIREAEKAFHEKGLLDRLARYHGTKAETVFRAWTETWLRPDFRDWDIVARLPAITCPLLVVGASEDNIAPPPSVKALTDLVGSTDKEYMELPGGHISLIAGRRASRDCWPHTVPTSLWQAGTLQPVGKSQPKSVRLAMRLPPAR